MRIPEMQTKTHAENRKITSKIRAQYGVFGSYIAFDPADFGGYKLECLAVYGYLCSCRNEKTGQIWLKRDMNGLLKAPADLGISRNNWNKYITILCNEGYITRTQKYMRKAEYTIVDTPAKFYGEAPKIRYKDEFNHKKAYAKIRAGYARRASVSRQRNS